MPLFNFLSFNTENCPQLTWWIKKETASLWFPSANTWLHFYSIAAINLLFILCFFPPCLVCLTKYVHCTVSQTIYWQLVCCFLLENHITEQVNGLWFFFVSKSSFFFLCSPSILCLFTHLRVFTSGLHSSAPRKMMHLHEEQNKTTNSYTITKYLKEQQL